MIYHFLDIFEAIEGKETFIETTHLVDKVFDPALNIHHTEDIIMNHLNAAENQYKQKLKKSILVRLQIMFIKILFKTGSIRTCFLV